MNKLVYPSNWILLAMEGMSYRCIQQYMCKIIMLNESSQKNCIHTVWLHLNKILENGNKSTVTESRSMPRNREME